jgi:hypothetical protein
MGRKPRVDRSPEEKGQNIQEELKSGNVSETCRHHGLLRICFIAGRMKRNRAKAALGEKRSRGGNRERQSHPSVRTNAGGKSLEIEILNTSPGASCGAVPSQAREIVAQGFTATLLAAKLGLKICDRALHTWIIVRIDMKDRCLSGTDNHEILCVITCFNILSLAQTVTARGK